MEIWTDGRSGPAGCLAGNLVLAELAATEGEFSPRKGTTFRSKKSIWIGRMCSTDAYLFGRDRHWANLSLDQHREVMREASLAGENVKYLFITALAGQPELHYWVVPAAVIEAVAFSNRDQPADFVYSLHIREDSEGRFTVERTNVTQYHHQLELNPKAQTRLDRAFEKDKADRQRRQSKKATSIEVETQKAGTLSSCTRRQFEIPLNGGRSAVLEVPVPAAEVDLTRIKGWIDLMNDVLTEPLNGVEWDHQSRRQEALTALKELQRDSVASGRDKLTMDDIENEIHSARRDRM